MGWGRGRVSSRERGVLRLRSLATVGSGRIDRDSIRGLDFWDALGVAHAVDVYVDAGPSWNQ
jgi:hypothetical protein